LDDWNSPLVKAFTSRKHAFFPVAHSSVDRKRRPSTPFEDRAFHVVPLGATGFTEEALGLLLIGNAAPLPAQLPWFTSVFGQKLYQIIRNQSLAEADRKQGRERALLHNIINA